MSKSLYDEAIADAQQLRELAEESAKNRVVEAIMPQIRSLVNRRILGEQLDELGLETSEEVVDQEAPEGEDFDLFALTEPAEDSGDLDVDVETDDVNPAAVINVSSQGVVNIDVDKNGEDEESEEEMVLTDTMAEALGRLIRGEIKVPPTTSERVSMLEARVRRLKELLELVDVDTLKASQKRRIDLSFIHCMRESLKLRSRIILSEQDTQDKLEKRLTATIKEMKHMSRSKRRNIFDFLFEAGDDKEKMEELEEAELSLELEEEEVDDLAAAEDAEAVDTALADILGDVEVTFGETGFEGEEEEVEVEEEVEGEGGEEEFAAEEEEVVEEVYEIDESALRRELRRMRHLREQEEAADGDPYLDHGGEDLGDVVLDVSEDDLLNALADELGDTGVATPESPSGSVGPGNSGLPESYRKRARGRASRRSSRRIAESRNNKQVRQYRHALTGMKRQLVEMNLFNAKLLYANKLMQNKNLTVKQQRAIVEALDNAKTLREAKLLYKSLSGSLSRRSRGKKLNEGSLRTLGSSSRSTRSAQPKSSGVEADRWAVLAGMNPSND